MELTSDIMQRPILTAEELELFIKKLWSVYAETEDEKKTGQEYCKTAYKSVFWTMIWVQMFVSARPKWNIAVGLASDPMAYYLKYCEPVDSLNI